LSAADGEQALRLFFGHLVDLAVLDYVMPEMDGGRVAEEMKRCKPSVPILLVSTSPMPEEILIFIDCRIDKGEDPVLLFDKIGEFLAAISPHNQPSTVATPLPEKTSPGAEKWQCG
jgi:CheY-like chemotaxis protein